MRIVKTILYILIIVLFQFNSIYGESSKHQKIIWSELPELPNAPNESIQPGLAGAFSGVINDILIVAGGANFPNGLPWQGGKKVWHDEVYLLDLNNPIEWIVSEELKLPFPSAYGVSIEHDEGLILIGGCNSENCFSDVILLKPDILSKSVAFEYLPQIPKPLAFMSGAASAENIFIAGGQETTVNAHATNNFFMLDLANIGKPDKFRWKELTSWPGPERVLSVSEIQSNGVTDCFYLFSGRNIQPKTPTRVLTDSYRYKINEQKWEALNHIDISNEARSIMAGSAVRSGANHILAFSGAEGKILLELEFLSVQIEKSEDESETASLSLQKLDILNNHPGFSKDVLAYHTITDTWIKVGNIPDFAPVTTNIIKYNESIIIPSGEIQPGIRTPKILLANVEYTKGFGLLNYVILGVYLAGLLFMGYYFSKREKTTDDFFKAGGRIPWWAAALSIFGTLLSAITFMAIPAKVYASDWSYFTLNASMLIVAPFIAIFILPFYRRLNLTTAYEFLEMRFNLAVRLIGSSVFILFQLGRIGIVLFLPSIALSVVTGLDIYLCITVLGVLSIAYTVLGGIEAVIWTDVIQVVVLMGGAVISLFILLFSVDGGFNTFINSALQDNKLEMFNFDFDFSQSTFWVILIGGIFINFLNYGTDQTVIQRYLTTKDEKAAAKSIWVNALLPLISTILFFSIGTALYVFFKYNPTELNFTVNNTDAIYPWYIITQLPSGIAGILIAAVFSASMSSLDSSMNSVATAFTTDFYRRFNSDVSEHSALKVARIVTVIIGSLGLSFALLMVSWDIKSLWDHFNVVVGLFVGGLGGIFLLGMFTKRTHSIGAILGLVISAISQYYIKEFTNLNFLLYAASGLTVAVLAGYLSSLLIPVKNNKIVELK